MQFHHAHGVRQEVADALFAEIPDAYPAGLEVGPNPSSSTPPPGASRCVRSRREALEHPLRAAVERLPGITLRVGHVDGVLQENGRARGVRVDVGELRAARPRPAVAGGRIPRRRRPHARPTEQGSQAFSLTEEPM